MKEARILLGTLGATIILSVLVRWWVSYKTRLILEDYRKEVEHNQLRRAGHEDLGI